MSINPRTARIKPPRHEREPQEQEPKAIVSPKVKQIKAQLAAMKKPK